MYPCRHNVATLLDRHSKAERCLDIVEGQQTGLVPEV